MIPDQRSSKSQFESFIFLAGFLSVNAFHHGRGNPQRYVRTFAVSNKPADFSALRFINEHSSDGAFVEYDRTVNLANGRVTSAGTPNAAPQPRDRIRHRHFRAGVAVSAACALHRASRASRRRRRPRDFRDLHRPRRHAVAVIGSLSASFDEALARQGRLLVGGDLSLSACTGAPAEEERAALDNEGQVTESASLRAMARIAGGKSALVEVKAVDSDYPLYGDVVISEPKDASIPWRKPG